MDEVLELTLLYDFYGELLTNKQRQVFELYYMDDYSLHETGEVLGISRQAVSELLSRIKYRLRDYEKKVGYKTFYERCREALNDPAVLSELFENSTR